MPSKKKIPVWDQRMLSVMDFVVANQVKCKTQTEFCKLIGIASEGIAQINAGKSSFRLKHILKAWEVFGVAPNYIFGVAAGMFLKPTAANPLMMIKEAVRMLEKK